MPLNLHLLHRGTRRRASGFTLVELLAVIAIIVILAAILIPVFSRVRASGRSAQCQSNLRQIWFATNLYVNEHRVFPYSTTPDGVNWRQTLRPYMAAGQPSNADERNSSAVVCPSRDIVPASDSANVNKSSYSCNPRLLVNPATTGSLVAVPASEVTRPSQIILFGDATQQVNGSSHSQFWSVPEMAKDGDIADADKPIAVDNQTDSDPQTGGYIRYRHNGSMNAVLVDGHVRNFRKGTILNRNARTNY